MGLIIRAEPACRQHVIRCKLIGNRNLNLGQHVPRKEGLLGAQLIINPRRDLMVVLVKNVSSEVSSAGIECLGKFGGDLEGSGAEARRIDLIIREGSS